ncbi:prestin-like isoform X2 [Tubulanus polymorphus]|uniref:prestin-like isoform X2 n=1 Tax=Tubulanus polymorphus TaxID=672921 RepID=UPI003DA44DD5
MENQCYAPSTNISRAPSSSSLHQRVLVHRPVYNQPKFDEGYEITIWQEKTFRERLSSARNKLTCSKDALRRFFLLRFPFIGILKKYSKDFIAGDIIAGITVAIMHIPQGMAYSLLASLPPVYGLYVSFFPVIFYFFFGTSRHISIGTFAVVCLMIGSSVDRLTHDFQPPLFNSTNSDDNVTDIARKAEYEQLLIEEKASIAMQLSLITGCVQLAMGFLQLGFLTIYLSDPLVSGFTTGAAMHVFTSQVSHIFGIKVEKYSGALRLIYTYIDLFAKILETNLAALVMSCVCIIILILVKQCINARFQNKMKMPVPAEIIVVVVATIISHFAKFEATYEMDVVGDIPTGIPVPRIPKSNYIKNVWIDAAIIAIVSYAVSMSMSKIFAAKHGYEVDSNQELLAHGGVNILGSLFNCFVSSASLSRSLIQDSMGGKTQIAGIVSSGLMIIVLLLIGPLFYSLPNCVLAAIIIVNLKGMFLQFNQLKRLWRISKFDFAIWIVSFLATTFLDVDLGLATALGFSLLTVIVRTQNPYSCILGRIPGTDIYRNVTSYKAAEEVKNVKIFRFEGSLYFANAENFRDKIYKKTSMNPRKLAIKRKKMESAIKREIKEAEKVCLEKEKKLASSSIQNNGHVMVDNQAPDVINDNIPLEMHIPEVELAPKSDHCDIKQYPGWPCFDVHHIILDCSTMGFMDAVGVKTLTQVIDEYRNVDVTIFLANCKGNVRETLHAMGFFEKNKQEHLYVSIHDAVVAALENDPEILNGWLKTSPFSKILLDAHPSPSLLETEEIMPSEDDGQNNPNCEINIEQEVEDRTELLRP